jgi:hypothetical protein
MDLDFKKIVIDGKNMSVVSIDEFNKMYKNKSLDTDIAVEFNSDYVLPYSKHIKTTPCAIPGDLCVRGVLPTTKEDKEKYSVKRVVNFSSASSFKDVLNNVYKIKEEKNAGLTIVNDCLHLDIYDEDTPELRIIKQAINDKHIDPDSYKNKFPSSSDFNNDMRALKSASNHSISFFKAKRILNSFDIDGEFIIRDKKDAVNPIGREYSIKLTEEE